ncbi:MAG: hypothetical protein IPK83_01005 [Planctomycetes bacterium]|nr:hypothetical protein [Planctomycetota bacterium]
MKQRSTIMTAIFFVLAGSGAGVVANYTWYGLDWVKEPDVIKQVDIEGPRKSKGATQSAGDTDEAAGGTSSRPEPANDPCAPQPGDKPMTVRMECVLEFLEHGGAFIVDAREDHEYSVSHFKDAIHIPASDVVNQMGNIMAAGAQVMDTIIVYCGGGECEASHIVARELRANSFERVYIYEKGWQEVETSGNFGAYVETGSAN